MIIINAENLIVGRMGAYAAKQALLGNDIRIINCDKAVISGSRTWILAEWKHRLSRGRPQKGPLFIRSSDRLVKRMIRGMLPYKQPKGTAAFKRIICYVGVPAEIKEQASQAITLPKSSAEKLPTLQYMNVKDLSRALGGKQ